MEKFNSWWKKKEFFKPQIPRFPPVVVVKMGRGWGVRGYIRKILEEYTAQKIKTPVKDFFSKYNKSADSCGFAHMFRRTRQREILFLGSDNICIVLSTKNRLLAHPSIQTEVYGKAWSLNYINSPNTEFFLNVFFCIQSECRKIRTRKIPYFDTFHTMWI